MWFERIANSPTTRAVELAAVFAEEHHRVLSENVANYGTPAYTARSLDPQKFQDSLAQALRQAERKLVPTADDVRPSENHQFYVNLAGRVEVRPDDERYDDAPSDADLQARLEKLLTQAAENGLYYDVASTFLKSRFDGLMSAIRGRA